MLNMPMQPSIFSSACCVELEKWLERMSIKELEATFPEIINNIFGLRTTYCWELRTQKCEFNNYIAKNVLNFLHPNGPFFKAIYKLLLDTHLKYEVPRGYLSEIMLQKLENASDNCIYKQKIQVYSNMAMPTLLLNPFEYYMFYFAHHLVNPSLKTEEETAEWNTVYLELVDIYLDHFVPCMSSFVSPSLDNTATNIPVRSIPPPLCPMWGSPPSIFREDVLMQLSGSSVPPVAKPQNKSSACIWRTEFTISVFIDFWFVIGDKKQNFMNKSWFLTNLPSKEQLRCIRLLIRHLHYFCNYKLGEDCPMNELKKELLTCNNRVIYRFFKNAIPQLPMDSSYKIMLEAWFTYIQPWRYTNPYWKHNTSQKKVESVTHAWFDFIARNLLFYAHFYYLIVARVSKCDANSLKISSIWARISQVFSTPGLLDRLKEAEDFISEDTYAIPMDSWACIITYAIREMEGFQFSYQPFTCQSRIKMVEDAIRGIWSSARCLYADITKNIEKSNASDNSGIISWFKEQFSGTFNLLDDGNDKRKILSNLLRSARELAAIHGVREYQSFRAEEDSLANFELETESVNNSRSSARDFSTRNSNSGPNSSRSFHSLSTTRSDPASLKYEGDPDLHPIRSGECKFMLFVFMSICSFINSVFSEKMTSLYFEDSAIGGFVRQILATPMKTYHYERCVPPHGYSERVCKILPPRLSLRRLATYKSMALFVFVTGLCRYFGIPTVLLGLAIAPYIFISSILFPVRIPPREGI